MTEVFSPEVELSAQRYVDCPRCGVEAGYDCRGKKNLKLKHPHKERIAAYKRVEDAGDLPSPKKKPLTGYIYADSHHHTDCPRCGSPAGVNCVTPKSRRAEAPHYERIQSFLESHPGYIPQRKREADGTLGDWDEGPHNPYATPGTPRKRNV